MASSGRQVAPKGKVAPSALDMLGGKGGMKKPPMKGKPSKSKKNC
jgi:hypothetical protein